MYFFVRIVKEIKLFREITMHNWKNYALFITILIYISSQSFGQNIDSTKNENKNNNYKLGLRTVLGYQNTIYQEIGLSLLKVNTEDIVSPYANCFYVSSEWNPKILPIKPKNIYGFKCGYLYTGHLSVGGLEMKYCTDFKGRKNFILTPKIGLSVFGIVNILYGYNISTKNNIINEIGYHQFSLEIKWGKYKKYKE